MRLKSWHGWMALLALVMGFSTQATAQDAESLASREPQYRIIVFKENVLPEQRQQIADKYCSKTTHVLPLINAISCEFTGSKLKSLGLGLKALPQVARVDTDMKINWLKNEPASLAQSDFAAVSVKQLGFNWPWPKKPTPPKQEPPAVQRPWGVDMVNAPAAWAVTQGEGVNVGIVDTGIDYRHPYLKANVKGGWNAISTSENSSDFLDDNGHGSHVSGTIAATLAPNGVIGIAPKANLYGVKVLDADGSGTFADVISGIQWATDHKMDVINMSLGADQGLPALQDAVRNAAKEQMTIIAAAGNSGGPVGYPAAYPEVIAISALADPKPLGGAYRITDWSSRGPQVAFIAPGEHILSTFKGGGFETLDGTSMATPHVVGLAALGIAVHHVKGPAMVREMLRSAATQLPSLQDSRELQGDGLINAAKLVQN